MKMHHDMVENCKTLSESTPNINQESKKQKFVLFSQVYSDFIFENWIVLFYSLLTTIDTFLRGPILPFIYSLAFERMSQQNVLYPFMKGIVVELLMGLTGQLQDQQQLNQTQKTQLRQMFGNAVENFLTQRTNDLFPIISGILALIAPGNDLQQILNQAQTLLQNSGIQIGRRPSPQLFVDQKEYFGNHSSEDDHEEVNVFLMSVGVQLEYCPDIPSGIKKTILNAIKSNPKCPITLDDLVADEFLVSDVKALCSRTINPENQNVTYHCHLYKGIALDQWMQIGRGVDPLNRQSVAVNQIFTLTPHSEENLEN